MAGYKSNPTFCLNREEAHEYVHNPARVDSRRGLKRSWVSSEQQPGPSSSSTAKNKPTSAEKGKTHGGHVKDNPVKTILKVVVSRKLSVKNYT